MRKRAIEFPLAGQPIGSKIGVSRIPKFLAKEFLAKESSMTGAVTTKHENGGDWE
jgi:hypothetical protein